MAFADVRWGRRCLAAVLLLALASAEAQQPGGDYRLPGDIEPLHYDLKLVPYLEVGNMRYTGTVDITFNVVKDTQTIILHAHKDLAGTIKIEGIVDASDQSPLAHLTPSTDADKQFYSVPIKGTLKAGNTYILSLSFSNKLQKDNYGFYVSSYDVPGGFEYMATTHLEATSARKAFPCFDEPTYRATFTVSLAKLDDQIALSNMPPASEPSDYDPSIGNRRWVVFQQTPKMPTYLLAFIVCKLKKVETSNPNINIYVRGDAANGVKKPAEVAPKLLSSLENFLGVSYPLPKLDLVAIPDFPAGAMENWGLITFKEDQLLVTDGVSGADRVAKSLRVIAHEFAHLWFGDLVTLKWWNTIWQQEGMAAFFESYILDKATDSEYGQMSQFGTNRAHSALEADALEHSPPLTKDDIQTPEQIEDHFGTITYSKGSNVHYMLMNVLGEDLYRQGLNSYLTSNEYTSTTIDDFAKALEDVAAQNGTRFPLKGKVTIKDLVSSWGNQAGYPVLTILRNWNDNTAKVSQARYLAHEPKSTAALDSKWTIPYSINSLFGKENTFTSVLTPSEAEQEVKLPYQLEPGRAFLWLNNHQSGFYRVNYDVRNWLLMGYGSNRMDAATRAATIDDLFALNRAGHVDTWIPLYYLQNSLGDTSASGERDVAPWTAGAKAIRGYSALVRGDPELSTYFQTFVAQIVAPAFEDIGFDGSDDSRYSTSVVRDIVTQLACENGLPECRRQALKAYNTISMSGDQEVYDPNVLAATTCTGALSFGAADLTKVIARVLNTEDVTARTSLLRGAGCVRSPALVQTLLGVATGADSGLSSGEAVYLLKSIMDHSPDGCDTALTYVHDNKASVDGSLLPSILQEIAKRIYKKEQLEKITELTKGDTSDATADMLAVAEATLKWAQGNLRELKEWVAAQLGVSPPRAPLLVDSASVPAPVPPTAQPRPTEPPGPAQEWLLPNHLQPERYSLDFTINMDPGTAPDKFSFSGVATIHINVVEATDKIVLHKHESLTVAVDSVESKDGDVALDGEPTYDVKHDFYTIALKEELKKGEKYTVKLTFSGPLKKDLAGLYLSSYTEGTDTKYLAVTQFEQTSARKAFPCFDEPKYRATFSISVIKHKSLGALSNTAGQTGGDVDKDHDIVIFEATPSMPTYLVALVVSELVEVKVTAATVGMPSISIWVRKEAKDEVGLAQELAPKVLKKLQALTGIPYVLPKLDLAAIPDFAPGAMENWGLITFKDTVLRTPKGALAHRRFNCARDITHEFSHLWFGDLVTNNWWSSLWQQEGMAAFMEAWVLDQATDYEYDAVARQSSDRIEQGLMDDALETAGPITNHTVGSPDQIEEHSGEITYNKGAGFLRMIRAILGEHTMWKGLRQYLVQHAYSTAGPEDLAAALQDAANEDGVSLPVTIQELMDSWTLKKGYPVLDVVRYLHDDRLTLRQSRFLSYTPVNETAAEEQWILPYNCEQLYRKGAKPFTSFLLSPEESSTLELQTRQYGRTSLSYIICNSEQEGFYRVNYDITSYRYLAKALSYGWIESDLQRGVLYDDALTLLRARRTEPYVVLYLLQNGVPGDVSLPVWAALSKGINYLRAALASDSAAIEDLNQYVRELTADSFGWVDWYNAFGWEESVQRNEVRQILTRLACDAREEVCVANAVNDYHKIAVDSKNYVIHQENYGALLCYNWQGADDVQKLQDELQKNSDYDQRVSIAYALGCVSSSKGRQQLLQQLLNADDAKVFNSNEITPFVESLVIHGGVTEALTFITGNWDALKTKMGVSDAVSLLQLAAERVTAEDQYALVKSLATADPSIYTTVAERSAAHGLAFAQDELGQVKDFLAANAGRTPPSPEPQQPTEYRLPGTVVPINYALTLKPVMDLAANDFSYTGEVKITVRVVESTDSIVLHSHEGLDVTLTGVTDDKNGEVATAGQPTFNSLSEMYTIKLAQNLEAEQQLVISLAFSGKLRKDKLGFYLSDYAEGVKWKYIATTQFEQTYARKAFPCFDEPKYRATFDISISREEDQIALSNMPLQSTSAPDANLGGRVLDTFQTTKPMPTYLVAFIVSELKKVPTSDPRISLYVRPDAVADAAFAAEITPRILAELEDFTGVPYALPKLDLVGIPDFYFGAMENWGLCTFRENRMLYAKGSATTEYKIFVAEVIAHELAHLWFGDYVTLDWWSSGWLKEGMAEFLEYLILDKIMVDGYDGWQPLSRLGVDDVNDGMAVDSLEHVRPLTDNAVATQDQIAEHMGDYTYTHGAGLQFLLMGVLGENNFRAGLKNYLTENAYGTGTPEKYAKALQEVADADKVLPSGITVLDIINSWSTKGGLPVVTVLRDYAANQVHVSQSRYLSLDPSQESTRDTKWLVPLAIYFNMNGEPSRFTAYLPENASSVTLELGGSGLGGGTVYGNWLQQGYYYTNYDFLNWIRIGSTIRNIDDPAWRALAIRDAFAVARAGLVDPWMPLYLLDMSIPQESNAAPWQATYDGLRAYAALAKADPEADQLFQMYLKTFIMEIGYNYVGWDNARGNKDGRVARDYATKLACSARVSDCRTKALQTYYGYLKDKNSPDPDTLAASLCEGLSHGDTVEYTALVEQLQATTERSRRMSIVYALGCVQNATIAKELLSLAGTMQGFEPQEVRRVFRSVMDNSPTGVDAAVDYVFNNFDFMAASLGQSSAEDVVLAVAEKVYSYDQADKLSHLLDNSYSPALVDALGVTSANRRWIRESLPGLKDWLAARLGELPQPAQGRKDTPAPAPTAPAATPTPGPGPTEPPETTAGPWRLNSTVVPLHYSLMVVPYLEPGHFVFEGKEEIYVLANEPTDQITMHAVDLDIPLDTIEVRDAASGQQIDVSDIGFDEEKGFVTLSLASKLAAGSQYNISLEFSGDLRTDNFGFYVSSYVVENEIKYMATTHFEATSARKAFPCFDEPRFRTTFDISVARLLTQTALSNMNRIRTSTADLALGGRVWDDFATTPSMPTYLVAFIVHELRKVGTRKSNINIWVRPNAVADAQAAAEIAPLAIQAMEEYTGFKLPVPKVDLVAIPTFPIGAMENWGLATFREDYLINPKKAKAEHAYSIASVVTHELSHYWFGDLVTIDWWSAAWLKEGMASFLELYMLDRADSSKYSAYERIVYEHVHPAMVVDARQSADVLTNYTAGSPDEISDHMGTITYSKGGSFLRMLLTFVGGEDVFRSGLSNYISTNAYLWGTPDKLASALQAAAASVSPVSERVTVQQMFDSWTLKQGYPVLTLVRDRENGIGTITQERFLSHEPDDDYDSIDSWFIPYNVWVQGKPIPTTYTDVLLEAQFSKTILLDDTDNKLVLLNAGQTGFYRVNYDLLTWIYVKLLLPKGAVPSAEHRAALIDDSFNLALAGKLDSWVPLSVLATDLPIETELAPWIAARDVYFRLRATLSKDRDAVDVLDAFMAELVEPLYTTIDWDSRWPSIEQYNQKLLRDVVSQIACTAGNELCARSAQYDFEGWYFGTAEVNPDTLSATLCTGLAALDDNPTFGAVWARFLTEQDPTVRSAYLYGFGCVSGSNRKFLLGAAASHSGIKSNEAKRYFNSFLAHVPDAVKVLLDFVSDNYSGIKSSIGVQSTASILQLVADRITSEKQQTAISELAGQSPCIEMTVVNQTAKTSLRWAQDSLPLVLDYLQAAGGEVPPTPAPPGPPTQPTLPPEPTPSDIFRLPAYVVPDDYKLRVVPYLSGDNEGTFEGEVTITFHVTEDTVAFKLHSVGLTFGQKNVTVTDASGKEITVQYVSTSDLYEWVFIALNGHLLPGQAYTVKIDYTGKFSEDLKGLYATSQYGLTSGSVVNAVVTKLAPTYARRVFPCFDEPAIRATFTLTVGRLPTETALSNTALQSTSAPDETKGGRVFDTFATTVKMPTHSLTVVVASGLQSVSSPDNAVTVYGTDKLVKNAQGTLTAAKDFLKAMATTTGVESGLSTLFLVGVRDLLVEGTDNWGIDIIRENALANLDASPSAGEATIWWLSTVAHRISQHWFGNVVSMDWWDNVWLTDGFATYFQYKLVAETDAGSGLMLHPQTFSSRVISPALALDSMESATALNNKHLVGSSASIDDALNDINTLKGGAIVNSLPYILGQDAFKNGLKAYLSANSGTGVPPAALYAALQSGVDANSKLPSNTSVETVLRSWVDNPGYPVVTVSRDYEQNTVTLTQERFLLHSPSANADTTGAWWIPIGFEERNNYTADWADRPLRGWIQPQSSLSIALPAKSAPQWLLINSDRKGFFRVNYDRQNWQLLALFLSEPGQHTDLEVPARVALLDDALALARAGRLDYETALQLADYVRTEFITHEVFETARDAFGAHIAPFVLESKLDAVYKAWVGQLLAGAVKFFDYTPKDDEDERDRVARSIVMEWACEVGVPECTKPAEDAYTSWVQDVNSVPHDTLASTVCAGVRNVYAVPFTAAVINLGLETNDVYRKAIIRGLGCTRNLTLAQSLLGLTADDKGLRSGEALEIFKSVTRFGPSSVDAALDYLGENGIEVYRVSGRETVNTILATLAGRVTTKAQYKKLLAAIQLVSPGTQTREVAAALLLANDNLGWSDAHQDEVGDMLYALSGEPNPDLPTPPTTTTTTTQGTPPPGPVPTDPATRPDSPTDPTWFTLPPTGAPTPPQTLPPLKPSTKPPTPPTPPSTTTTTTTPSTTTPAGAAGVAANILILVASSVVLLRFGGVAAAL